MRAASVLKRHQVSDSGDDGGLVGAELKLSVMFFPVIEHAAKPFATATQYTVGSLAIPPSKQMANHSTDLPSLMECSLPWLTLPGEAGLVASVWPFQPEQPPFHMSGTYVGILWPLGMCLSHLVPQDGSTVAMLKPPMHPDLRGPA